MRADNNAIAIEIMGPRCVEFIILSQTLCSPAWRKILAKVIKLY